MKASYTMRKSIERAAAHLDQEIAFARKYASESNPPVPFVGVQMRVQNPTIEWDLWRSGSIAQPEIKAL